MALKGRAGSTPAGGTESQLEKAGFFGFHYFLFFLALVVFFTTFTLKLKTMEIFEPSASYGLTEHNKIFNLIELIRTGIKFSNFNAFMLNSPFSMPEWARFLHLSERTMQRIQKDKRKFDSLQSEKILEIVMLYNKGTNVFGDPDKFNSWLNDPCIALDNNIPKHLLDNSFGINLVKDELSKIEHGILA